MKACSSFKTKSTLVYLSFNEWWRDEWDVMTLQTERKGSSTQSQCDWWNTVEEVFLENKLIHFLSEMRRVILMSSQNWLFYEYIQYMLSVCLIGFQCLVCIGITNMTWCLFRPGADSGSAGQVFDMFLFFSTWWISLNFGLWAEMDMIEFLDHLQVVQNSAAKLLIRSSWYSDKGHLTSSWGFYQLLLHISLLLVNVFFY